MNILVTGSSGQLGEAFEKFSKSLSYHFIFADRTTFDITNVDLISRFLNKNPIDFIINCAAYTAVDLAENNQDRAFLVNEIGVENLVNVCEEYNIAMIHFSTDYVFDGNHNKPYKEINTTNPLGVYGMSKLAGEHKILKSNTSALILRTSWLYSKTGKNFYNTMCKLGKERQEIKVVADQIGTPTHVHDLVQATICCIEKFNLWKNKRQIFHFSNEGVASWYDFSKAIFEINNIKCKVYPIQSDEYPTLAKRPFYSVLNKQKFKENFRFEIKHWRESLLS